ncbi:hypothetical protein LSH36_132g05069, partial [Paralvinella palmiformis]
CYHRHRTVTIAVVVVVVVIINTLLWHRINTHHYREDDNNRYRPNPLNIMASLKRRTTSWSSYFLPPALPWADRTFQNRHTHVQNKSTLKHNSAQIKLDTDENLKSCKRSI